MAELTAALRFAHFAAAIALAGELAFLLWVARSPALDERGRRVAWRWLALLLASGIAWFLVQATVMSGGPEADGAELAPALTGTLFGQVAIARLVLALALAAALRARRLAPCGALAFALLASLAATGHGAAEQGTDRVVHMSADALHLLAAAAWVGALPGLVAALRSGDDVAFAARAARRFSAMGIASVATLVATGAVNAWYTVGDLPALFGTAYGRLLCAKLAVFAAMLALAAANRLLWTPRLLTGDSALALSRLRRNAIAEGLLGLAVLGLVASLGVTVPALHAKIVWPFSYTIDWRTAVHPRAVAAVVVFLLLAAGIIAVGAFERRTRALAAGVALFFTVLLGTAVLYAVPAHPTTYFESPVTYTAVSVLRGAPLYAEHCARCHGDYGNGDGPIADALPRRPPSLVARLAALREGDLLWAIVNGVPGTTMPAFAGRIGEEPAWDLLNFIRAQANVDAGRRLDASVDPWRPVTAPDFTFQIGRGAQESLFSQRSKTIVLLVFYTLPQSLPRLRELATAKLSRLDRLGVRVIAVPLGEEALGDPEIDATMLAGPDPALAECYAMFTRTITGLPATPPRHVEFLIDRQGYIRARSVPSAGSPGWAPMFVLLRQSVQLNREKGRGFAPRRHAH